MKKILNIFIVLGIGLILFSSTATVVSQPNNEVEDRTEKNLKYFDSVLKMIETYFFDKNYCGFDLKELRKKYENSVKEAETKLELHQVINKMIAEFKVSHFAIVEYPILRGLMHERLNTLGPEFGFKLRKIDDKYFATRFSEGGSAEKAGLKYGDEIIKVNDVEVSKSELLFDNGNDVGIPGPEYYILVASMDETVKLEIKRTKDAKTQIIEIKALKNSETKSTENSVRVIEKDGKNIAYIHAWHFLTRRIADIFHNAIDDEFENCDSLILDIRGHGGSPIVIQMFLASFKKLDQPFRRNIPFWDKPFVVLTDEGTRSAKEIFAYAIKKDKLGTLVGRRTQGAVLGTNMYPLSDGSALMIPVVEGSRYNEDGKVLEGVGVEPDIVVPLQLEYANGVDEVFERGLKEALSLAKSDSENKQESDNNDF